MAYDSNNPFARILRGEAPCHRIYEDERTLAFMDIMPRSRGHCLVIPKNPARSLLDVEDDDASAVMQIAAKLARASMTALGCDGVELRQSSEPAAGQVVFHLHVHVIPRWEGVALLPAPAPMGESSSLEADAHLIAAAISKS